MREPHSATHVLREYRPAQLTLSTAVVDSLVAHHSKYLSVAKASGSDQWTVTPNSHVGSIRVEGHTFLIQPKVGLPNLLALMDIEIPSESWGSEVVGLNSEPDLLVAMARLFCVASESATRQGIRRSYVPAEERLVSPRGRIDVAELSRRPGLVTPVPCRFDDHTVDVPINRIVKAGLERARRTPGIGPRWQRRLLQQLSYFEDVGDKSGRLDWVLRWQPTPMERHYETVVRLAHLLLTGSSLQSSLGSNQSNTFILNMNSLFELWVTKRLQEHCRGFRVVAQDSVFLGRDGAVKMNPDITFWSDGRVVAIADCKYKLLTERGGRSPDYYQALAYATAYDLDDSWLLYARSPGEEPDGEVSVRNTHKTLRTVGIDLTGHVDEAIEQVRAVGDLIAGRAG